MNLSCCHCGVGGGPNGNFTLQSPLLITDNLAVLVIGICGGTGAGKTALTRGVIHVLSEESVVVEQDHYYRDLEHLSAEERAHQNFDHPDSIDTLLMIEHIRLLRLGRAIDRPVYDFTCHARAQQVVRLYP